jgi:hypothetical protein
MWHPAAEKHDGLADCKLHESRALLRASADSTERFADSSRIQKETSGWILRGRVIVQCRDHRDVACLDIKVQIEKVAGAHIVAIAPLITTRDNRNAALGAQSTR